MSHVKITSSKQLAIMKENSKQGPGPRLIKLLLLFLLSGFFSYTHAQTVSGTVSDESGKKLSSVSVAVKGTSTGTTTDAAGQYKIDAAANATLVFSSVGYASMEVPVANRTVADVT